MLLQSLLIASLWVSKQDIALALGIPDPFFKRLMTKPAELCFSKKPTYRRGLNNQIYYLLKHHVVSAYLLHLAKMQKCWQK
jgi:hypothetical protein